MGTSTSSNGPGPGVPLVPPWAPPAPPALPVDPSGAPEPPAPDASPDAISAAPDAVTAAPGIAPERRFLPTRRALGDFGRAGNRDDLRKALGNYVKRGYGGAATAARRMSGTATTAGALGGVLAALANDTPRAGLDRALLASMDADRLLDAVVESVRSVDGTQDAEAERRCIREALTETLEHYPDANLLGLDNEQRAFAIERFVAFDVFARFELDVGKAIVDNAPSAAQGLARLDDARGFIREAVGAAFRDLARQGHAITSAVLASVVAAALKLTFTVFEDYV
ncbi:MAG TPA: Qat anti-phage system associated protein QatB [Rhodanobacter sp.]